MLRGPRVELRAVNREDLPRICEFHNDVEIALLLADDPVPRPLAYWENKFDQQAKAEHQDDAWFGIWTDGKLIGETGLEGWDATSRNCELGIWIGDREYWGKGYGRETIRLLLDYAFRIRNQEKVWLTVNGDNERAYRCYRACGFVEEGRLRRQLWMKGQYIDYIYMGILREEWEK